MSSLLLNRSDFFLSAAQPVAVELRNPQDPFPQHHHDFDEIVIVWRGNGLHVWNELPYRITYGDMFYITQQDSHYFQSVDNLELANVLFCRDRLRLGTNWNSLLPETEAGQQSRCWRLTTESMIFIRQHIQRLTKECAKIDPLSLQMSETLFLELALLLVRHRRAPDQVSCHVRQDIDRVLTEVGSRLDEKFDLAALCARHQLSPRAVRDSFKQLTGMTISGYLLQRRLCHAINLLRSSELPIAEIAASSGFNDSNYFAVIFQKTFNQSPSHCRRVLQDPLAGKGWLPLSDIFTSTGENL